jgi:hypothetical protein
LRLFDKSLGKDNITIGHIEVVLGSHLTIY